MQFACCSAPAVEPLTEIAAEELSQVLKVLADPVRLRLISLIARAPEGDVCACDLVDVLGRSQPTISHHLKVLFEAGVLGKERRGSWIHYSIRPDAISGVCDALGIACTPVAATA
ncbi:MAG: ArsR/SmtB family transcription factor [Acidimicrobiales bacterium]